MNIAVWIARLLLLGVLAAVGAMYASFEIAVWAVSRWSPSRA